ncbi:lymphatic vessel endothelial hyaluronic receptor 1b%2C partial [Xyrichtys novacula]|uniref:Lymphatic vessel endothelial hyaluronic receptor 1b, partial n=1 Tax=Xyrichtys novacula TaxID=13765 RepID=A0AAV1F5V1_XYRNO|nr:lymphatic vessel endothelial hyaluronic receptor 1b%2C partial [Xyrichtys novacula]
MAGLLVFTLFLFWSFTDLLSASDSHLLRAVHQSHRAAGVFLLIEGGAYTFNFTAARDACLFLNVTMATRDQMERALQRGLETCKFGWIAEQVAVVPRLTGDEKCGQGKTGVVSWAASTARQFGAFCFNSSALWETQNASTPSPQSSTPSNKQTAGTWTPAPPAAESSPTTPTSEGTSFTPAPHANTKPPTRVLSASTTREPPPLPSEPSVISLAFTTTAYASFTSESVTHPPVSSEDAPLGDVSTALIVLGVIALLEYFHLLDSSSAERRCRDRNVETHGQ